MADGGNSGAAAAAAPAAAGAGIYRYKPPDCLHELLQNHKRLDYAVHSARKQLDRERQNIKNYKAVAKSAAHTAAIASTVLSELPLACTCEDMVQMTRCEKAIADLGGMDELHKIIKLCKEAEERAAGSKKKEDDVVAKSSERVETNRKYRAFLKSKGLKHTSTYKVKWTNLVDFFSKQVLPEAHSFVIVMPDCETKAQNPDSDPNMVHIRLPFVVFNEVNELYMNYTDGIMELVTDANAMSLCSTVFDDENVKLLYAADGGGEQGYNDYRAKLVKDSIRVMSDRLKDFYPTVEQMTSFTGQSSSRARGSVDYCERSKNKRSRQDSSGEEDAASAGAYATADTGPSHGEVERLVTGVLVQM